MFEIEDIVYKKLVDTTAHGYNYWAGKCKGMILVGFSFKLLILYWLITRALYITFVINFLISELGKAWTAAIADSAEKLKQIETGQKLLTDHKSFWLGGSTNAPGTADATIDYLQYVVDETGGLMWNTGWQV